MHDYYTYSDKFWNDKNLKNVTKSRPTDMEKTSNDCCVVYLTALYFISDFQNQTQFIVKIVISEMFITRCMSLIYFQLLSIIVLVYSNYCI